jgi:hypothetical protein
VRRDYPTALEHIVMRALEKRPQDRYQSAEDLRHDLEEFLDDSGLRSGNRRMAIYMNELFKTEAAAGAAAASGNPVAEPEELDFDRRAPLSMRIEPAVEVAQFLAPRPPAPVIPLASARAGAPGAKAELAPRVPVEPAAAAPPKPRKMGGWILIAAVLVLGIGTMVFLTLR